MMYNMIRPLPTVSKVEKELRRGPWTHEEDILLTHYIAREGEGRWKLLAKSAGLKRTGKSCRLRWLNYLKPDVKRGNLTRQEQLLIVELHSKWGNKWSKIAQELPGRTDNEIKNYWRTKVQKQARQMKIETNSKEFIDVVRCCYVPRLLQQLEQQVPEQSSSCFTSSSSSSSLTTLHNPQTLQETASPPFTVPAPTYCTPQTTLTHFYDSDLGTENSSISVASSRVVSTGSITNTKQNQPGNFLQYPTRDATTLPDTSKAAVDYNSIASDCYYVDYGGQDLDGVPNNLAYMSYQTSDYENASYCEFQVAEDNWVFWDNGVAETLWNNMDDIWQLRE